MSWIGTGRFIFSHDLKDADFDEIANRFVAAAQAMQADGWWLGAGCPNDSSVTRERGMRGVEV